MEEKNELFDQYEFASDKYSETLNYMSKEEFDGIYDFDNEDDLRCYLNVFIERT